MLLFMVSHAPRPQCCLPARPGCRLQMHAAGEEGWLRFICILINREVLNITYTHTRLTQRSKKWCREVEKG